MNAVEDARRNPEEAQRNREPINERLRRLLELPITPRRQEGEKKAGENAADEVVRLVLAASPLQHRENENEAK